MNKSKERDDFFIRSMYEEITNIENFMKDATYDKYLSDKMMRYAVYKACENIGEAVDNLSDEFKNNYPDIPWRIIKDYRNVLTHEYFGVDTKETWKVAKEDIPNIKNKVKQIIETLDKTQEKSQERVSEKEHNKGPTFTM